MVSIDVGDNLVIVFVVRRFTFIMCGFRFDRLADFQQWLTRCLRNAHFDRGYVQPKNLFDMDLSMAIINSFQLVLSGIHFRDIL